MKRLPKNYEKVTRGHLRSHKVACGHVEQGYLFGDGHVEVVEDLERDGVDLRAYRGLLGLGHHPERQWKYLEWVSVR